MLEANPRFLAATSKALELLKRRFPPSNEKDEQGLNAAADAVAQTDPTREFKYIEMLTRWVIAGSVDFKTHPEDIKKIRDYLKRLESMRASRKTAPDEFESSSALFNFIEKSKRKGRVDTDVNQALSTLDRPIDRLGDYKLYRLKPEDKDAVIRFSKHSNWCTKNAATFSNYIERGPIYLVTKGSPERLYGLFQPASDQLRNAGDEPMSIDELEPIFPMITKPGVIDLGALRQHYDHMVMGSTVARSPVETFGDLAPVLLMTIPLPKIVSDPELALAYARFGRRGPFKPGEPTIATDTHCSYRYAYQVLKGPFKLGEPAIAEDADNSSAYATEILGGPFKLGEPTIAKSACASYEYARDALKGQRFELGEPAIAKSAAYVSKYASKYEKDILRPLHLSWQAIGYPEVAVHAY